LSVVLLGAGAMAQEDRPPLDACAALNEANALVLLPGATRLEREATAAQPPGREVSGCTYRDGADPSRSVTLSIQRFPTAVPTEIGWALFNDHELERVDLGGRSALWKPSMSTMMLVLRTEFITLSVTRPEVPATLEEVRTVMKQVHERWGAPASQRSVTAP
jgi:hypothetical protein